MLSTREKLINSFEIHSSRNALCINNNYYTYSELWQNMLLIHSGISQNVKDVDIIGLVTNNDLETYAAILAIWFSGKGYVPLNPKFPFSRNKAIIDKAGLKYVISSERFNNTGSLNSLSGITEIHTTSISENNTENTNFITTNNGIAYILFTSGSTGTPKGVPISFANWESFLESYNALGLDIDENDRCLQMFDLTFDVSVSSYIIPLLSGACVYTVDNEGIKYLKII